MFNLPSNEDKDPTLEYIPVAAVQGLELHEPKKSVGLQIRDRTVGKWTAQGINDFQKTLFPLIFLTFSLIFSFVAYFKIGDIEPEDLDN